MFGRFMPKEGKFFTLFQELSEQIVLASRELQRMADVPERAEDSARAIKDIEHRGDDITHATMDLLHSTFITPLDREDIHALVSKLDDILDFMDAASQRIVLYDIKQLPEEGKKLVELCGSCAELVRKGVLALQDMKRPHALNGTCVEINRIENEADHVLRSGLARLFKEEEDLRQLIKLKEIYELLEAVTDRAEDAANIIDGIVLEYA